MSNKMKAITLSQYGGPEVCSLVDFPMPSIDENGILIKIEASTVNRTDCGMRTAEYVVSRLFSGLLKPNYKIPGCEFAGRVVEIGASVKKFKIGDRVFGYDDVKYGGNAEYIACTEKNYLGIIPEHLTFTQAAALSEGAHYALSNIRSAKIVAGDRVLLYGATGGIGTAALQLMKAMDVHVTAVCDTARVPLITSLGADTVIDYFQDDYRKSSDKFRVIFDAVGKISFDACKHLLMDGGIYMSTELGPNGENVWKAMLHSFNKSQKRIIFPIPSISQEIIAELQSFAEKKLFTPIIDRTYPLSEYVEASRYVESAQKLGNVVLTPIN